MIATVLRPPHPSPIRHPHRLTTNPSSTSTSFSIHHPNTTHHNNRPSSRGPTPPSSSPHPPPPPPPPHVPPAVLWGRRVGKRAGQGWGWRVRDSVVCVVLAHCLSVCCHHVVYIPLSSHSFSPHKRTNNKRTTVSAAGGGGGGQHQETGSSASSVSDGQQGAAGGLTYPKLLRFGEEDARNAFNASVAVPVGGEEGEWGLPKVGTHRRFFTV